MFLEWVQTFTVAAKTGNFRETADRLHLAQPTVSQHISKLEKHLGVTLFERRGRNVHLNAAGRRFLPYAEQLIETSLQGKEDLARWQQGYQHTLTVAVSPLIATTFLPDCVHRFTKEHPDVEFSFQIIESRDILNHVLQGDCDFGLSRMYVQHPRVACDPLASDPVVLVAPAEPDDLESPPPDPAELLSRYPVLTHNHPEYWDELLWYLRTKYRFRTMRVSQVHVTLHWIARRLGVSFLPFSTIRLELLRGTIQEVPVADVPLPMTHTYLVADRSTLRDLARLFADFVCTYVRQRAPSPGSPSTVKPQSGRANTP
ncbi:HTH-type transcriptional regulator CitR [Alicyclobacillus hesperidum]|uniref:HTH-type transcriptional regulator CitR n=1 Tax=Alicyclobacillus hesperidum TaxID=89784 RepID=A0A1H2TWT1_9BACL|nr:LysR family transcriptional regulator [Alicyclobacillus hesperidum]GLV14997.1 HTH-type transcriptional regulator CitR [Alicyclobacillus hesperidum]SDW48168.1 LysR family transcriptional regulator, repressor for citA [Alicyclobacillus hesperidum]